MKQKLFQCCPIKKHNEKLTGHRSMKSDNSHGLLPWNLTVWSCCKNLHTHAQSNLNVHLKQIVPNISLYKHATVLLLCLEEFSNTRNFNKATCNPHKSYTLKIRGEEQFSIKESTIFERKSIYPINDEFPTSFLQVAILNLLPLEKELTFKVSNYSLISWQEI